MLEHQDENIEYEFEKGGFALEGDKLFLSIEATAIDDEAFPDSYKFALDGYILKEDLDNAKIRISTNPNDEQPNVFVYTSFHACEVEAELSVKKIAEDEIEVRVNIISKDVNYYNEKAKPNPFKGSVVLYKKSFTEMWIPT
ncbi:hypothetical protein [Marinagarivorans algicola]|uniref:hypothetical protein n=1 Tax=Marinagarivorans algicola TaxID=1513270 RepID=UPI0012E14B96|nr:hypothetical protein [Marinagarivorans algicola]